MWVERWWRWVKKVAVVVGVAGAVKMMEGEVVAVALAQDVGSCGSCVRVQDTGWHLLAV